MRRRTLLSAMIISGCAIGSGCSGTGSATGGNGVSENATDVQQAAIKKLEAATGNAWSVSYDANLGTPYHAAGLTAPLLAGGVSASQAALTFFAENKEVFGMEDPAAELTTTSEETDEYGWHHANFQQHVGGVPIYGGAVLAHYDTAGSLRSVGAHYVRNVRKMDINPKVATKKALDIAVADWKANFQPTLDETKDFLGEPDVALYIYDVDGKPFLAWFVQVNVEPSETHDPGKLSYWVDAHTGDIIHKYNGIETVAGSGTDVTGNKRFIEVSGSGSSFTLVDTTRPSGKVTTYDLKGATTGSGTVMSATSADGPWTTGEPAGHEGSGVGAHYYSEMVWDYFKQIHNRDSFDNAGMAMKNRVHYSKNWANASWDGTYMNYGDGDGKQLKNLTGGFDVIAHELTHGVTQKTSKLAYTNQPGGLNEGMSDILGNLAEHWLEPNYSTDVMKNPNLAVGEAIGVTKPLRYMCAPKLGLSKQIDNAGEYMAGQDPHLTSGVPNSAWCLMTIGGKHPTTGTTVNTGIGWDKSAKIWYLTETKYILNMAQATYAQAAKGTLDAAAEIGLTQNEKNIVQCGWIATKVITSPATCADTTGGDGIDGGTTHEGGAPPQPPEGGTPDVRTDTPGTPDVTIDQSTTPDVTPPTDVTPQPDTTPQPEPQPEAGRPDAAPEGGAGRAGSSGAGGATGGASGAGGTGGVGGSTGGAAGATGGTSGTAGAGGATGGAGGSTGGTGTRGGSAGSGGSSGDDSGCGCEVPGRSAPSSKSTIALALGFVAAVVSRRRRRHAA
jgi:bacillolysin